MRFSCFFVPYPYIYIGRNTFPHLTRRHEDGKPIVFHVLDHLFLIREQVKRDDAFVQADNLDVVLDEVNNIELALRELLLLEDRHDLTDTGLLQFRVAVVVDGRILDFHCCLHFFTN